MDSDFDEKDKSLKEPVFDSKDIVEKDNSDMFTRIEGAEERAKKAAAEAAKRTEAEERQKKRAEDEEKRKQTRAKNQEARTERKNRLYHKFWAGDKKKKTIAVIIILLLIIFAYPIYLGGSGLIKDFVAEQEKREEAAIDALPENYVNIVYQNLVNKYKNEGFDAGEQYFNEELNKAEDDAMRGDLHMERANALTSVFDEERLDEALESALKAEELSPSDRTAVKLMSIYQQQGNTSQYNKYKALYNERIGAQETGGRG